VLNLDGGLVQSMFFVPGTPVYETTKNDLLHTNWEKYCGNVVHFPKKIKPHELQQEIIKASAKIYSVKRLIHALFRRSRFINKILFIGEFFWQASMRADLKKELAYLKSKEAEWCERNNQISRHNQTSELSGPFVSEIQPAGAGLRAGGGHS
jgi:hypothetical protein